MFVPILEIQILITHALNYKLNFVFGTDLPDNAIQQLQNTASTEH